MTLWITPREFHETDGVGDWRVLGSGLCAYFRTGSFPSGLELVKAIGDVAVAAGHHPAIDLRPMGVTVSLKMDESRGMLLRNDVELARTISGVARSLGAEADPTRVEEVHLTIDALVTADVRPFWRALLSYREIGEDDLVDRRARHPSIWFQPMNEPRTDRNRIHVDVFVPHDQAETRIEAAIAAGGHLVTDAHAPSWWVLADAEGNEACVATWMGRD